MAAYKESAMASLFNVDDTELKMIVSNGIIKRPNPNGEFDVITCVRQYVKHLQNGQASIQQGAEMHFPTAFAKDIAISVGLYPELIALCMTDSISQLKANNQIEKLKEFQQMSIFSDTEMSMNVYHADDITDEQKTSLELIHKTTKDWAKGHVADSLLQKLNSPIDHKLVGQAAALLLNGFGVTGDKADSGSDVKRLFVELTN